MNEIPVSEVPNTFNSLFWGYSAIWAILAVYIVSLLRRVRSLERRLDRKSDGSSGI